MVMFCCGTKPGWNVTFCCGAGIDWMVTFGIGAVCVIESAGDMRGRMPGTPKPNPEKPKPMPIPMPVLPLSSRIRKILARVSSASNTPILPYVPSSILSPTSSKRLRRSASERDFNWRDGQGCEGREKSKPHDGRNMLCTYRRCCEWVYCVLRRGQVGFA